MAQYSRPTPDNGRVVTDDDFENLNLGYSVDGLIGATSDTFPIYADSTGRQVKIRINKLALVRGYLWGSDTSADEIVAATTNTSGNPRIDRLVLQLSRTTRNVRTALKTGTPAATPTVPALTQNATGSGVWEFPLARWQVAAGYTTIAASDIVPEAWYLSSPNTLATLSTWAQPSGSALRSGQLLFETDTGFVSRWSGSKWLRLDDEQVVVTDQQWLNTVTNTAMTNTNVLPQRTQGLTFPVAANARYSWELRLQYIGVNSVGLGVRALFPASAKLDYSVVGYTSAGATYSQGVQGVTTSPTGFGTFGQGASSVNVVRIGGLLATGASAGDFVLQFAQGTASGANGSWVLQGTSLRHRQLS